MKTKILVSAFLLCGCFMLVGVASANNTDILQPASDVTYNENLVVNGTGVFDSIKVGKQGVGGVTFFNGTIINTTTDSNGGGIPVTFGDDVRIDGKIWRGSVSGPGDSMPVKIDDDMEVEGEINGISVAENVPVSFRDQIGAPHGGWTGTKGVSTNNPTGKVQAGTYNFDCQGTGGVSATSEVVTLPESFDNAFSVSVTLANDQYAGIGSASDMLIMAMPTGLRTFEIDIFNNTLGGCPSAVAPWSSTDLQWIAVGY